MSRLDDLENQIEEALEAEYRRGRQEGYEEAADDQESGLGDALDTFERLRLQIVVNHYDHDGRYVIQYCSHPLCKAYVEHRDSLGVHS